MPDLAPCRCGHTTGPHACHRCLVSPGTPRYYAPTSRYSLAGAQMKSSVRQTIACDACWLAFADERAQPIARSGL